jgi:hypothetical protein
MRLYHFTNLASLIGYDGIAAFGKAQEVDPEAQIYDHPASGSILKSVIQPKIGPISYNIPVVWLTRNPNMNRMFVNSKDLPDAGHWRITVELNINSNRIVSYPEFFAKHVRSVSFAETFTDRLQYLEATQWWVYKGTISQDRWIAVDHMPPNEAERS